MFKRISKSIVSVPKRFNFVKSNPNMKPNRNNMDNNDDMWPYFIVAFVAWYFYFKNRKPPNSAPYLYMYKH